MSAPAGRRGFLRGLVSLPLIGGGVTLIGAPSAVAGTPPRQCVDSYMAWLHTEFRAVHDTCYRGERTIVDGRPRFLIPMDNPGAQFHFSDEIWEPGWGRIGREAVARAPLVLAAVGCNWREGGR